MEFCTGTKATLFSVRVISTAVFENNQKYQVKFEGKTKINLPPQQ